MHRNEVWSQLMHLEGSWDGLGTGEFPTIEPFTYRERLDVSVAGHASLHYRKATWRTNVQPEAGSHIETGFINVSDDGTVTVLNAQGPDRVEVLKGTLARTDSGFTVQLASVHLANDERMVASWRRWELDGQSLHYTMGMRTTAVPDGGPHLEATLHRTDAPPA